MATGNPTCLVAQLVWLHGSLGFEPPLPRVVPALAGNGPSAVVGANSGYYVMLLAQHSGVAVVAYEPFPPARERLEQNLDDNGLQRVVVRSTAAGAQAGAMTLHIPSADHGYLEGSASLDATFKERHSDAIAVDVVKLDDEELLRDVELVLIDVEGAEADALRGARELLSATRPFLVVEIGENSMASVGEILAARDYVPFEVEAGSLRQQARLSVPAHTESVIGSASRATYWNMVFAPRERVPELVGRLSGVVDVTLGP